MLRSRLIESQIVHEILNYNLTCKLVALPPIHLQSNLPRFTHTELSLRIVQRFLWSVVKECKLCCLQPLEILWNLLHHQATWELQTQFVSSFYSGKASRLLVSTWWSSQVVIWMTNISIHRKEFLYIAYAGAHAAQGCVYTPNDACIQLA